MVGNIIPISWVVENLMIDNKNMAILWGKNYGVLELWVHVKWPIIHKEWGGGLSGGVHALLGQWACVKTYYLFRKPSCKIQMGNRQIHLNIMKSKWIPSCSILCQV